MSEEKYFKKIEVIREKEACIDNQIFGRNKRKLLAMINRSNSAINNEFIKFNLKVENEKNNIKVIRSNLFHEKKEKELNDLEKIYKKWNQDKILSTISKKRYKNMRTSKNENEKLKISYELSNQMRFKKKLENKLSQSSIKRTENNSIQKKKKGFEGLKEIVGNNRVYSSDELKNIENEIEMEINEIYRKANIILDKKNEDLIEKFIYILKVGKLIEKEIMVNKNNNLILPGSAILSDNIIIKFLGYFGSELSLNNIKTYIELNPTNEILRDITFKIITSGLATQKIYKLTIDNQKFLKKYENNIEKINNFLIEIKMKIGSTFNVSPANMYFFEQKFNNNFEVKLIIYNQKVNNLDSVLKKYDVKITTSTLLNNIILSPSSFEGNFSKNENDWPSNNLIRGGKKYYPPYGCIGIALKIKDKFNTKNNIWLGKENKEGEWCVAYHGVGKGKVLEKVLNIINDNLREGYGQMYNIQPNTEKNRDIFPYCGIGVYFSPNIDVALKYADRINLGWHNLQFKFVIMARVNPSNRRSPGGTPVIWISDGNDENIRPYRLLIKVFNE